MLCVLCVLCVCVCMNAGDVDLNSQGLFKGGSCERSFPACLCHIGSDSKHLRIIQVCILAARHGRHELM